VHGRNGQGDDWVPAKAEGEDRAIQAAEKAIANPLLDRNQACAVPKGVLTKPHRGGPRDVTLFELDEAADQASAKKSTQTRILSLGPRSTLNWVGYARERVRDR